MNKKCQVFTPPDCVEKLLDSIDYTHDLYGKKILENSCGDGSILTAIVQRYINDCKTQGLSNNIIKSGLSSDIFGMEIDSEQYEKCIEKLNQLLRRNNLPSVTWSIFNEDYLKTEGDVQYDYIVGNPPYIAYSELKSDEQIFLKKRFQSCEKGKFDYCYAFIEKSIESLSETGRMAYLIPSSVFKTVFGKKIRGMMLPFVKEIIDYTQERLFKDVLVKSSIVVLDKGVKENTIHYVNHARKINKCIKRGSLGDKWNFNEENNGERRFGDFFKVSHAVATLCNKAFIINNWIENDDGYFICGEFFLEPEVLRDAHSPKNRKTHCNEKIIFPYGYTDQHQLIRYSESDFRIRFPGVYSYLEQYKADLKKCDRDKASLWFEYGRSQALNNLDYEKALISRIISSEVSVYKLNRLSIPYAGMYITPINNDFSIDIGITILRQEKFLKYAKSIGIPVNGNSVRITSKDIEDFLF